MSNLITSIFAINFVVVVLAGAYVYFVNRKKAQNGIWLVYNILFAIWNLCIYQALFYQDEATILYWMRTSLVALIFMVPVFLHFLSLYSDREVFKKQILGKIYILSFLFFGIFLFLPTEFVRDITSGVYFKNILVPGTAFNIFVPVFAGFIFCGFYYLLHARKLYLCFKRNQRICLFLGMLFGIFAPVNFILAIYKIDIFPVGPFCVIPYAALAGYAILKHHVFEMDIIINKTVVLSYFTLFVLLVHIFIVHILHAVVGMEYFVSSIISGAVVLLNILFTAHYAGLLKLERATEHIVYEKRLNYYKFLKDFSSVASKITELPDLANYALDSLIETIGIENATLYLYDEKKKAFGAAAQRGMDKKKFQKVAAIPAANPFIKFLKEGNIYVTGESNDFASEYDLSKIRENFSKINISLAVPLYYSLPLYHSRDMIGFLNLGDKKDKSSYNKEDIDILNAFGRQLSVCIDNVKLYSRAIEDDLTGLYRINYFNTRIQEEIERANRYQRQFSLLLIDVDDFKKINDTYGHPTGDRVLKRIAYLIKSNMRKADIAARYGGEEFSVLMPETDRTNATIAAERLRRIIEEEFSRPKRVPAELHLEKLHVGRKDRRFSVTISIGIADYKPGKERYELIKEADQALYKAKREGKNRVC